MDRASAEGGAAQKEFRADINGLRGIAVAAVVLYHFRVPGAGGGFVGVDVFFVLSGFLMTSLLLRACAQPGPVSGGAVLVDFYLARASRIVPGLAALCVVLMTALCLVLPARELRELSLDLASALQFWSNLRFRGEAGYFDTAAAQRWMLHTWSLSVEWQFYLLFPLLVLAAGRLHRGTVAVCDILVTVTLLSFATCVVMTASDSDSAFYLLPSRAWEMLAGGLVVFAQRLRPTADRWQRLLQGAGLLAIVGSVLCMDAGVQWPGWRALVPVAGCAAVLLAGRRDSRLTANAALQWLGSRSYSIYLWHWPFAVVLIHADIQGSAPARATAIVASLLAGHVSYRVVELPSRRMLAQWRPRRAASTVLAGLATVMLAGVAVKFVDLAPSGRRAAVDALLAEESNRNPLMSSCHAVAPAPVPQCRYGGPALGAIVIGDSHAASFVRATQAAMADPARHVLDWTYASCPTLLGVRMVGTDSASCDRFLAKAIGQLSGMAAAPVLVINRTSTYLYGPDEVGREGEFGRPLVYFADSQPKDAAQLAGEFRAHLVATACAIARSRPTYLLRPIPEMGRNVPRTMARALQVGWSTRVSISLADYHRRHRLVWEAQDEAQARCGVHVLDPLPYLCSNGRCYGDKDGRPLYYDDDHLSEAGTALLVPLLERAFMQGRTPMHKADDDPSAVKALPAD